MKTDVPISPERAQVKRFHQRVTALGGAALALGAIAAAYVFFGRAGMPGFLLGRGPLGELLRRILR